MAVGACLFAFGPASAGQASLSVTAYVIPNIRANIQNPIFLIVNAEDIRRGYKELPNASVIAVESNFTGPYQITFYPVSVFSFSAQVSGLDNPIILKNEEVVVVQRQSKFSLSYQIKLPQNLAEGTYSWPFKIEVRPLG